MDIVGDESDLTILSSEIGRSRFQKTVGDESDLTILSSKSALNNESQVVGDESDLTILSSGVRCAVFNDVSWR